MQQLKYLVKGYCRAFQCGVTSPFISPLLNKKKTTSFEAFWSLDSCVEKIVICLCMFMFFIKSLFIQRKLMLFKAWQQNFHSTHIHASEH